MYGLVVENLAEFIRCEYGEEKWEEIRRLARVEQPTFSTHHVYPDSIIPKLAQKATKVLGITERELFESMGEFFVGFVGQYGYDRVLSVLGRHLRDFLNGLDNLHEYLKFSYPRMRAPSFFCENENEFGLTLHYRSKRKGYVYYTMGQIREVARRFYHTEVNIELVREEQLFDTVHVTFQLHFENKAFLEQCRNFGLGGTSRALALPPVASTLLFEIFPFCIVFGSDMVIRSVGHSLKAVCPHIVSQKLIEVFDIVRPLIDFNWQTVLLRTNNIFELVTLEPVKTETRRLIDNVSNETVEDFNVDDCSEDESLEKFGGKCLSLKGQMLYMEEWKCIIYIGTPMMQDLDSMIQTGLYINDLSMHDFSRDLMLAGTQQSVELKLALDQEQHKSKRLEESMRKLDEEMKRTDELLYQMIPRAVADRLRKGEPAVNTCEVFESLTILFSDVVTFTNICSRISPMEVVSLLNSMYSIFDELTEKHCVYKVETIGDAYMIVSGAPDKRLDHAEKICAMALDMLIGITGLKDPSSGASIQIRIGIHTGTAVAGVVGLKMPRYCLFGDTVNTASRMESTGQAMKIHISENTKELLPDGEYEVVERGAITIKGKGNMKTYWLLRHRFHHNAESNAGDSGFGTSSHYPNFTIYSAHNSLQNSPTRSISGRSQYSPVTMSDTARRRSATVTCCQDSPEETPEPIPMRHHGSLPCNGAIIPPLNLPCMWSTNVATASGTSEIQQDSQENCSRKASLDLQFQMSEI